MIYSALRRVDFGIMGTAQAADDVGIFRELNSRIAGYFPNLKKAAGKTICE